MWQKHGSGPIISGINLVLKIPDPLPLNLRLAAHCAVVPLGICLEREVNVTTALQRSRPIDARFEAAIRFARDIDIPSLACLQCSRL